MVGVLDADVAELAVELRQITVRIHGRGAGAGVIWRRDGLIVTNAHVAQEQHPEVMLWDGRRLRARRTAWDSDRDLATLQLPAGELPAARPGNVAALRVGNFVLALGHPFGLPNALSLGIVHAVGGGASPRWIRADIRLAPGNSGGPLVDAQGQVIGLNTLIAGGLAYAIPITAVTRFLQRAAA